MIPFLDLQGAIRIDQAEIDAAVLRVLESGPVRPRREWRRSKPSSPTTAASMASRSTRHERLHLALLAAGVGPGDEVITVPFTFVATAAAIGYTGASRCSSTSTRTRSRWTRHSSKRPSRRGPGRSCPCICTDSRPTWTRSCDRRRHGLIVIEDACQAHGAEYKGRSVGPIGDSGCFSFYPGKNLGAYGEGGAVVTNDAEQARTMRMLRDWGQEQRYQHVLKGFNYRMEGLQGSILRVKLRHLERWTELRRTHAAAYQEVLRESGLSLPSRLTRARLSRVCAIRVPERDRCSVSSRRYGIQSGIHYPIPVHLQTATPISGTARAVPRIGAGGQRGPVAPHVPGNDPHADRRSLRRAAGGLCHLTHVRRASWRRSTAGSVRRAPRVWNLWWVGCAQSLATTG